MLSTHFRSNLRAIIRPVIYLSAAVLSVACDGGQSVFAPAPTVTGTVTSFVTGKPVAGAEVRIGSTSVTTGADGRFALTDLTTGAAMLRSTAVGFVNFETGITVASGSVTHHIRLARVEVYEFGEFALYVPANADIIRGVILALGGPDTRGFATGKPLGAPLPAVEASLQALGQAFRTLAFTRGLAVLGTRQAAMPNTVGSDQLLLNAVQTAATMSGRPELATAPLLLYGMSGGGPQASGFTARNPGRVAGLFLKVPSAVSSVTSGEALRVPTYVVLAELDVFVNNAALTVSFDGNRGASALWALAKEMGVPHHSLTAVQRQVTVNWINTILELRLPATLSGPLREIGETSGWLGDRAAGKAAPWASYLGNRSLASWLPSQSTAQEWETLVVAGSLGITASR